MYGRGTWMASALVGGGLWLCSSAALAQSVEPPLPEVENPVDCVEGQTASLPLGSHTDGCEIRPGWDIDAATFEANVLTSDRGRFDRMMAQIDAEPALVLGSPTLGWIHEALRSVHTTRVAGFAESISTPIRVFSAGGDRVVPIAAHHYFAARLPSAEIIIVDQAQHELFIESDTYRDPVARSQVPRQIPSRAVGDQPSDSSKFHSTPERIHSHW